MHCFVFNIRLESASDNNNGYSSTCLVFEVMQLDSNDTTLASCIHVEIVHLSILYKQDFSQNTVPLKNYHFTVNLGNYKKTDTCHSGHKMLTLECVVNMSSVIESSHLQCGTIMH